MRRFRPRSAYDVLALVSFFLVIGGGTALASFVVTSNGQVAQNTISGHKPPPGDHSNIIGGSVNGSDLASNSVSSSKVVDGSLLGADVHGGTIGVSRLALPKISWSGPDTDPVDGVPHHTALTIDGVTIGTSCASVPPLGHPELAVFVSSSTNGTLRGNFAVGSNGDLTQVRIVDQSVSSTPATLTALDNPTLTGEFNYSNSQRVISFSLDGSLGASSCSLHGTVVPAPN